MTDKAGLRARAPGTTALATLALLSVTATWGSTFVLIKDALDRIPVADFLAVPFAIAALALWAVSPGAVRRLSPRVRRQGVLLGLVYGAAQLLQTAGLEHTAASVSGFITGMYVVFTPLLAAAIFRQQVGRTAWLAVGLATVGLAALSLQGFAVGLGESLTLLSAALYAVHIVGLGAWATSRDAYGLAVLQMAVIAAACGVGAAPGGLVLPPTPGDWVAMVYMALVAGALALVAQTWAQAHLTATRAAVVMTMEPVFAAFFAVALGGEVLTTRLLVGGALVLTAMYVAELGPRRGRDAEVTHLVT
jgi:drug/metabolite transporter (DMT)-like permease